MVVTLEYNDQTVLPLLNLSPCSALNFRCPAAWIGAVASGKGVCEAASATPAHSPQEEAICEEGRSLDHRRYKSLTPHVHWVSCTR